jgi:lipopolysaccharide export system permease protein
MRLLDRYLLRELLVPFVFCLSGFLIFWISGDLFGELSDLQDDQLTPADIVIYYLARAPDFAVLVFPIALLLALLYALTNHQRHNELTAIRAAGVGLWRMCVPYFAVGFFSSLLVLAINELIVPKTNEHADRIRSQSSMGVEGGSSQWRTNIFFRNSRDGRYWQIGAYHLDTHQMIDPNIHWQLPDGSEVDVLAKEANFNGDSWDFKKATVLRSAPGIDALPTPEYKESLTIPEFIETPEEINSQIRITGQSRRRSLERPEVPVQDIVTYLRVYPDLPEEVRSWLMTQLHGRMATPWTCLVVVLIAMPFGLPAGRRNVFVGVASSILICFIYIIAMRLGLVLGTSGNVPSWLGAWLPNILFAATGIWMTARVR